MDIELVLNDKTFIIQSKDNKGKFYEGRISDLDEVRELNDLNQSEWIIHLMGKTWINSKILYELAQVIKKEFPNSKINWEQTFLVVEKHFYQNNSDNITDSVNETKKLTFKSLLKKIQTHQEDSLDKDIQNDLQEITRRNIKEYKL